MWDSREVGSCVQFRIHASPLICIYLSSDASAWRLAPFLCVLASASERVLVHPFWKARNPRVGFSLVTSPDAVPKLSLHNTQGSTCCSRYPAAKPTLTSQSQSPVAKPTLNPVLKIKSIHYSKSWPTRLRLRCRRWSYSKLSPHLVWGGVHLLARKTSTSCAWYFYVHFYVRGTSTCTFYMHFYVHGTSNALLRPVCMALLRAGRMELLAHHFYVHLCLHSAWQTSLWLRGWLILLSMSLIPMNFVIRADLEAGI